MQPILVSHRYFRPAADETVPSDVSVFVRWVGVLRTPCRSPCLLHVPASFFLGVFFRISPKIKQIVCRLIPQYGAQLEVEGNRCVPETPYLRLVHPKTAGIRCFIDAKAHRLNYITPLHSPSPPLSGSNLRDGYHFTEVRSPNSRFCHLGS